MSASSVAAPAQDAPRRRRWWQRSKPRHAALVPPPPLPPVPALEALPPPPPPPPPPAPEPIVERVEAAPAPTPMPAPTPTPVLPTFVAPTFTKLPTAPAGPVAPTPKPAPAPPEVVDVSRHQELRTALQQLERRVGDVKGAVVASRDGLALASTFIGAEGDRVAAMAASVVGLAEEILADGGTSTTIVRGATGCLVVHPAGTDGVLAARTGPNPNVGLLHVELPVAVDAVTRSIERC